MMLPDRVTRLAYGLGAVPFGAKLQLFGLLLLFYNQLLGLPAAGVSAVLAASVVLDAVWDPLVGQISDSTRSRWGRRHPYLYGVALPLALSFALLWRPPAGWSQPALLGWLAMFAILTRLLISLQEIPSAALLPELARGYDERTALVGYRYFSAPSGRGSARCWVLVSFCAARPYTRSGSSIGRVTRRSGRPSPASCW
jgi:glycoside/pentoside/hexuronide:cation symporter, GPH family